MREAGCLQQSASNFTAACSASTYGKYGHLVKFAGRRTFRWRSSVQTRECCVPCMLLLEVRLNIKGSQLTENTLHLHHKDRLIRHKAMIILQSERHMQPKTHFRQRAEFFNFKACCHVKLRLRSESIRSYSATLNKGCPCFSVTH